MDLHDTLNCLIPYRLETIATFNLVLRLHLHGTWDDTQSMQILINEKLVIKGNPNAFTNPVVEVGVIHCRALLEFLGLGMSKAGALQGLQRPRNPDDVGIENFSNENGPLTVVSPGQAIARYPGGALEAEQALLSVFRAANKGLAHLTSSFMASSEETRLLEIASRGVPALVISHLYTPLGIQAPEYQRTDHARENS
jgi:hypothetical protein